jgi:hypothetical protein
VRLTAREAAGGLRILGFAVSPVALRLWRHRGHIGPGPGYDVDEIAAYLHRRATRRAGRVDVSDHDV